MLLTGFAIVFAVLVFLIFLIWTYATIVSKAQSSVRDRKIRKQREKFEKDEPAAAEIKTVAETPEHVRKPADEGIPEEVIAVISAAVYSIYGSKEKVRIKSVKRAKSRPAWANAGIIDNTRPF